MPNLIQVWRGVGYNLTYLADELKDGYIAFAYPGKFIGWGETMEEALMMAKVRYKSVKKKFLESKESYQWELYAEDRCDKMNKIHSKKGISKDSAWSEDNVEKT